MLRKNWRRENPVDTSLEGAIPGGWGIASSWRSAGFPVLIQVPRREVEDRGGGKSGEGAAVKK